MKLVHDLKAPRWAMAEATFAGRLAKTAKYRNAFGDVFDGNRLEGDGFFEVVDGIGAFEIRRVYSADDEEFLCGALAAAEARYPSKNSYHNCVQCWMAAPCLAIRAFMDDEPVVETVPIYIQTGCGSVAEVFKELNEKLNYVRMQGIDAFVAWVDRVPPKFS